MVGMALRNESESTWEATLEKIKKELSGVQKPMEISVKMSYDHLESEELKSFFLLCAQMGRQQLTTDLVKYCFGLGILEGIYTIREARERIFTSIQKLKNSNLMQDGSSSDRFDMHDMVRDAALSIAHKVQNVFALRNGKLDDWPDKDELEKYTAISICNCDIIDELPEVLNCPQVKFFQIDSDDPSLEIPDNFFEGMKKLRVLILTGFHLQRLPLSIKCLLNLRMLCLERCTLVVDNLSIIGELKKLKILSFSGSQIENLPAELGCLDKLQLFDISDCSIMKVVPPNFISRLTCLEELYIRKSLIKMEVHKEANQSQFSFLSQLKHLHQLRVVDLCIPGAAVLPRDLFFDRLNDYKIVIGDFKMHSVGDFRMPNKYEAFRSLALHLTDGADIHFQKGIKLLFKRVENLLLGELNGVQNAFCELNMDGFPDLKHLSIVNNIGIEYIINSMELSPPQNVFPILESLCLYKLRSIKTICYAPASDASFTNLKTIKVKMCTQLKNLFSFYKDKLLANLETVEVSECDSLEVIVVKERQAHSSDKVKFPKLRSLTLQSLPSFSSFYANVEMPSVEGQTTTRDPREITTAEEDDHNVMAPLSLFSEQVEIPNLESLELSSINSHKIWSDQPLSSSCFQKLTKLTVKDCHNLRYLCSLSVASGLKELKGLFISECLNMEGIFDTEGNSVEKAVCVFPKLEEIRLTDLYMLTDIWHAAEVGADSFSSLISVQIERCDKLDKIFPSHMTRWFRSLESLKVVDCMSVELIFEIEDTEQKKDASGSVADTKLQLIHVDRLYNLRQIWGRDPGGILSFKNLRSIWVGICEKLRYVLPASVAKDLESLESISVWYCYKMEEIVAWEDGLETPLKFPKVICMQLSQLSIRRFYKGSHIECPKLKQKFVFYCEMLETFTTETNCEEGKAIFDAGKVISNLEIMVIDSKEALRLQSNHGKCLMHCLKDLALYSLSSIDNLYWLLHRMPNLESLTLFNVDKKIEELVPRRIPQERLGTVIQLKKLILQSSAIKDLGLERDPVLQRLEHLILCSCHNLINLASSLTHLTYLEVIDCNGLTHLMASSTAKSMVQLATMKVIRCELNEIVTNEGNEEGGVIEVVFSKLISIELVGLKNLTSFCSSKNCKFKFPSLERLIVRECPSMVTFTESCTTAPKLQNILAVEGEEEEQEEAYWEGDLNATIQKVFKDKVFFEYTEDLNLSDYPEFLEQVWHCNALVHENMFHNLITLTISQCGDLVHVIPSHLLPCLGKLEELYVMGCSEVQVIFNINDDTRLTKALGTFRLKKLSLDGLPKLEHVWDKDPEGIFCLQVLHEISVEKCDTLKSLFPASVAKDLTRLEVLSVTFCRELVEIFSKDETAAEGATKEFVFPCLTWLELTELPALKYFYPDLHKLEWPLLKELHGYQCNIMTLKLQEDHAEEQALIQIDQKVIQIPCMMILSFGIEDAMVTWDQKSWALQFDKLQRFQEEPGSVLYRFLGMLSKIEKLKLRAGSLEEVFSVERPNADYTRVLSHLKQLKLIDLENLQSIGLEHSGLHPIPENLEILKLKHCARLINLVPHTVSFSNLTYLQVLHCKKLLYLFTSSTAKSLCRLKEMKIIYCESMQEIVSTEGDESHGVGKIMFEQLQTLYLEDLPKLRCFYRGNFALCFPSLEKVSVIRCSWMKTFCPVNETKLSAGITFIEDAIPRWEGDLNSTVCKRFVEEISKYAQKEEVSLIDEPLLQGIWQGSLPVSDMCFSNLVSLIVSGCQFLSEVLPSNLLPSLTKMERLEVQNCSSVKTIFDVKRITEDRNMTTTGDAWLPLLFSLKILILKELPNLENVWNEDPHGILRVQLLEEVHVDKCKCLTSLFPLSVAKDLVKLEHLHVQYCEELMVFVEEDNADPKGVNSELTFPCVISLTLLELPKLNIFYRSLHCDMLKKSTHQESHTEDEVIYIEKLTPNLQSLSLGEKELKMIWRGNLLHKLKYLGLLCFHVESDVFPYRFLQQVPNLEKLLVCCSSFKEIFCFQRPDVVYTELPSRLKVLRLELLTELVTIGLEHSWIEPFLRNLETLEIVRCFRLRNLAASPVCFSNLMHLRVSECHGLVNLFTSSTAKSLCQLKEMKIERCESLQEVVFTEGGESHEDEKIIFGQLHTLFLEDLPKLRCFYPGNLALCFPALEKVSVIRCSWMKTFCPVNETKLSAGITFVEDATPRWEGDLNSTVRKMFVEEITECAPKRPVMNLIDDPLQELWQGSLPLPNMCFSNLVHLIVNGCQFLSEVLPSNLLPFLTKLEKLEVRNCISVKTIFDVKCVTEDRKMTTMGPARFPFRFSLKILILEQLPNLENVWNADPKGVNSELTLPRVISLTLLELPKLNIFYRSLHCDMLKKSTHQESHTEDEVIYIEKLTPNLQSLSLGEKELKMIWRGNLLHKLKYLGLLCFHVESDVFPYRFLQQVPNLEKLLVCCSSFKEIFCFQRPDVVYTELPSRLKVLRLELLTELVTIGLEHSWIEPFLRNLETLEIVRCFRLRNLAASPVCFSNLMHLRVSECHGLVNLFTSSTAKSLCQLKEMKIERCESLQEVVFTEGGESHEDEKIIFGQLHTLFLEDLPKLRCFYPGNLALCFPALEKVSVIRCSWMKTFCPVNETKLSAGITFVEDATPRWEGDLNSTVRKMFVEEITECAPKRPVMNLIDDPLQELWQGSLPLPNMCFSNLVHLIVNGCQFLSEVLPSNLLPFLTKLEKLEVRNCISVKTIFDVKCVTEDRKMTTMAPARFPLPFSLKILILEQLPNLENVWNEDPDGILRVQLLEEVYVDKCKCLTSLFPASVAKDLVKLENLHVKHCKKLMVIVAEDNTIPRGTKSMQEIVSTEGDESHEDEKIIFEQLRALYLKDLQELKCFYSGNFTVCFPSLERVSVINCHKMETFCRGTINADKLLGVNFDDESDAIPLENDLNSTIRKAFLATSNKSDSNNSARGYIGRGD